MMRHILNALCLGTAVAVLSAGIASANDELAKLAKQNNIQPMEACTLVLLSTGQY